MAEPRKTKKVTIPMQTQARKYVNGFWFSLAHGAVPGERVMLVSDRERLSRGIARLLREVRRG